MKKLFLLLFALCSFVYSSAQDENFFNIISQPGAINQPYQSYTPTFAGFSTAPIVQARYFVVDGMCHLWITTITHGISNSTSASGTTFTLPFTSANTAGVSATVDLIYNNGRQQAKGLCVIPANSSTATVYLDFLTTTTWTANGNPKSFNLTLAYEVTGSTNYSGWTPSWGGFSVNPTVTARSILHTGGMCHVYMTATGHGTSNNTGASSTTFTLPYTSATGFTQTVQGAGGTASTRQGVPFVVVVAANSNVATVYRDGTLATTWNGSGNKSFNLNFFYETTGSSYSTWTPTFAGFSTDPTVTARYYGIGKMVHAIVTTTSTGVSNATAPNLTRFSLPFVSNQNFVQTTAGARAVDNGSNLSVLGQVNITTDTDMAFYFRDDALATWTGSGNKNFSTSFIYEADNTLPFEVNDSPGDPRQVIITMGQSNLGTGITTVASNLEIGYKQTYNHVRFLEHGTDYSYNATTYQALTVRFAAMDYTNNKSYQTPDQNGAYSLQFYLYPECQIRVDRNLYVIHHGKGNTGLSLEWKSTATIGDLYRDLVYKTNSVKNKITDADGVAPDFKFLLIVHGEYDSRDLTNANNYETNLTNFINNFRSQTGLTNLPVIIVKLNNDGIDAAVNPLTYANTIRTAQDNVEAALSDVYLVESIGAQMQADEIHYTVTGEHTLTDRILAVIDANNLLDP